MSDMAKSEDQRWNYYNRYCSLGGLKAIMKIQWTTFTVCVVSSLSGAQAANCTAPVYKSAVGDVPEVEVLTSLLDISTILDSCDTFNGSVRISLDYLQSLHIDQIKYITGDLQILTADASTFNVTGPIPFSMNSLESIGGDFSMTFSAVSNITVPSLVSIGRHLKLGSPLKSKQMLESLELPNLSSVGGTLSIVSLDKLKNISLPALISVGSFQLDELPVLTNLSFASGVQYVTGYRNPQRHSSTDPSIYINGTQLHSIDGLCISNTTAVTVSNNPNLVDVTFCGSEPKFINLTFPSSGKPSLHIANNGPSTALNFLQLTSYGGDIDLINLHTASFPELRDTNGTFEIAGNVTFSASNLAITRKIELGSWVEYFSGMPELYLPQLQYLDTLYIYSLTGKLSTEHILFSSQVNIGNFIYYDGPQAFCQFWAYERCMGRVNGTFACGEYDSGSVPIYRNARKCNNDFPASGWTLDKKLGLGLGIGLGVPALMASFWWRRRRRRNRPRPVPQRRPAVELADFLAEEEQLPKYQQHESKS